MELHCTGGIEWTRNYYITCRQRGLTDYLFTSKNFSLPLTHGLAICKAFELYDRDEVRLLFGKERSGLVTDYVRGLASYLRRFSYASEIELERLVVEYNEKSLAGQSGAVALDFRWL